MDYSSDDRKLSLMRQIYTTLLSLVRKLDKQDKKSGDGLTAKQCVAVLAIYNSPNGEASMISLAKKLGTTKQNINQIIPVLERKGYVKRLSREKNKRSVSVEATGTGMAAIREYVEKSASFMAELYSDFDELEMETLLRLLQKLYSFDGADCADLRNDVISL